jgi:hypothetical protein
MTSKAPKQRRKKRVCKTGNQVGTFDALVWKTDEDEV